MALISSRVRPISRRIACAPSNNLSTCAAKLMSLPRTRYDRAESEAGCIVDQDPPGDHRAQRRRQKRRQVIVKAVIFDDGRVPAGGRKMQARRLQHRGGETLRARWNVPGRGHGIEPRGAGESAAQPEAVLQPADSARLEQRLESRWAKLGFG